MIAAAREETTLQSIDPLDEAGRWDELVRKHPQASIFHSSAWARVLWETYRFRPFFYAEAAREEKQAPAILALVEAESWVTGRRGVSAPFADECSILPSSNVSIPKAWDFALRVGEKRNWRTIEVRGVSEESLGMSLEFYQHTLPLFGGAARVFEGFDSSVRRAIRKAERSGIITTIERTEEAMRTYYQLHCLTRKKHGLPPQPLRFFLEIWRQIVAPGLGFVTIARLGKNAVAGAVFFEFQRRALYKYGASDPAADCLRPSNHAMWSGISELCERGATELSFGRSSLHNSGLRQYKLGWGSQESRLRYTKWNFGTNRFVQETDRSTGWQNAFFRKCPKAAARMIGRFIYPHIA